MTLLAHLHDRITAQGPITVADFMADALLHPKAGYYTRQTAIGAAGDFITAPEISQMFGELIGLCLAQCWMDQGAPAPFTLAELGPGRGTLMADIWRATARVPGFHDAAQVWLIEASPRMRLTQQERLAPCAPQWAGTVADLPTGPLFVVANEFFDALPVRQFVRAGAAWRERCVGLAEGALSFGLAPAGPQSALAHRLEDTKDGDLVETCPAATTIASALGAQIAQDGGAALVIDYGDWRSLGNTLQAVKDHQTVSPLSTPGAADLTAHVDFEALAQASSPAAYTRLTPQGVFLERLGITERAQALAKHYEDAALEAHIAAHRRLTHPEEMGNLFKVLGLYPRTAAPPPGLMP